MTEYRYDEEQGLWITRLTRPVVVSFPVDGLEHDDSMETGFGTIPKGTRVALLGPWNEDMRARIDDRNCDLTLDPISIPLDALPMIYRIDDPRCPGY